MDHRVNSIHYIFYANLLMCNVVFTHLHQVETKTSMYTTGNIYLITAIAVTGGGLFGFDISSMSAIISTQPYLCYFNQGTDGPGYNDSPTCVCDE
jgi:hypothetical protein